MDYNEIISSISSTMNIPEEVVNTAYRSYWKYVRDTIQELPLNKDMDEEEFNKLRTNFNVPSLGKLSCTYSRIIGLRKKYEYLNKNKQCKKL